MDLPAASEFFRFQLGKWEAYGLFFLLGSFTVATLSDLRRLSAQREFLEIWILFVVGIFGIQLYQEGWTLTTTLAVKWAIVLALSILSWAKVGILFRLAIADVAACAAAASLLAPGFVVVFWLLLKLAAWVEAPLLRRGRSVYPFMPVVMTATVLALGLAFYVDPLIDS
jgi:hypothetical protein